MTTTHTIQDFAHAFEVRKRPTGEHFTCLKDEAPEAFTDLVHELHGGSLPNDTTYRMIAQAAEALAERCAITYDPDPVDMDADLLELADSLVDIYTADLLEWAGSDPGRIELADEVAEEMSPAPGGILDRLRLGQFREYFDMLHAILNHFEAEE